MSSPANKKFSVYSTLVSEYWYYLIYITICIYYDKLWREWRQLFFIVLLLSMWDRRVYNSYNNVVQVAIKKADYTEYLCTQYIDRKHNNHLRKIGNSNTHYLLSPLRLIHHLYWRIMMWGRCMHLVFFLKEKETTVLCY